MALSFLSGSGSASHAKFFDIRLDQNVIVLRGAEQEASSVLLRGTLILCLSEPLKVGGIHMRLTGESRISWCATGTSSYNTSRTVKQEAEFYRHGWTFVNPGKKGTEILPAGNYEYPFEKIIPGDTPESVEGLPETWVIYRMKATIDRGRLQQNIHARKHVRIVRTLDPGALELAHAMSVENIWPDKVKYSISIPTKAIIFGTSINVDFELVPLLKGLKIGKIITELIEVQDFTLEQISQVNKHFKGRRLIKEDEWELPEDWPVADIDGQDGSRFVRSLQIPMNLKECIQDVEVKGIMVKHKLKFCVKLINPDSHVSELRATLPVMIFISPNLPLNEQNQIINQNDRSTQAMQDLGQHAPPMYGEHQFDQLYSSVDPSGFMTPADGRSGVNTPYASESRNASSENLASMNAVAQGTFSAHVLQGRLHNIQDHGSSRFARDRSHVVTAGTPGPGSLSNEVTDEESSHRTGTHVDSVSGAGGSNSHHNHSDPILRRASDDEQSPSGSHTPHAQHLEIDEVNEIYRLPSYGRAVRTPVRTPANEGPPTYQAALRSTSSTPPLPLPQLPTQAHTTGSSSYFREPRTSTSTGDASPPLQREYRS